MSRPVLWQIRISHFSEKVRWALAYKGVEHDRRAPMPSSHIPVALWLTRGRHATFPVIQLDGRTIADSSAIIAALEERYPEPPLYPDDLDDRRRALELEEFFDEELGPHVRRLAWHELSGDRQRLADAIQRDIPAPLQRLPGSSALIAGYAAAFTALRYRAGDDRAAQRSRAEVLAALDRLEAELGDSDYLVGDRFTVADLTAAALFYPLVLPPEGPSMPDPPPGFEGFRAPLKERRGYEWVAAMFRKHRRPAREPVAA